MVAYINCSDIQYLRQSQNLVVSGMKRSVFPETQVTSEFREIVPHSRNNKIIVTIPMLLRFREIRFASFPKQPAGEGIDIGKF